ncbi:polyprenyl synthetase family protein [Streptomyces sp. NPDC005794]|uniref:polyprenyl synthetase family protein n=1 Tax=Streptomyces sp. NPDC005794 TaxID=3364733 RepID=UPI0036AC9318
MDSRLARDEMATSQAQRARERYSVLAALQLGLLAAGEPRLFEGELREYARPVGNCGQMRDDYLDLFGDADTMGKQTGTDLRDGKHSYTVRALLAAVDDAERRVVEGALGDASCTPGTIAAVREIGEHRGVADHMRADMRRCAQQASAVAVGWRPQWRDEAVSFFEQLPLWSVERAGLRERTAPPPAPARGQTARGRGLRQDQR